MVLEKNNVEYKVGQHNLMKEAFSTSEWPCQCKTSEDFYRPSEDMEMEVTFVVGNLPL
jgi:hypothetical protein